LRYAIYVLYTNLGRQQVRGARLCVDHLKEEDRESLEHVHEPLAQLRKTQVRDQLGAVGSQPRLRLNRGWRRVGMREYGCISILRYWSPLRYSVLRTLFFVVFGIPHPLSTV